MRRFVAMVALALGLGPGAAVAGTTGSVCGRVAGPDGQPVNLVTVMVEGTGFGTYTDASGNFCIGNIPPGSYTILVSRIGFATTRYQSIGVSADNTTRLDVTLVEKQLGIEEVVVEARRPPVDLNLTSTSATLDAEEIRKLPVQELQDVVDLQAGVVDGHFRGGRLGEVQYQVDGVSVNNAYDNKSILKVDRALLQEVQVISGTFDAEYGQAMSGVVNAVLKEGTDDFHWSAEAYGGAWVARDSRRPGEQELRPAGTRSLTATLRGPLGLPRTTFMVSGRGYRFEDYVSGRRIFMPTDRHDFEAGIAYPTGDGAEVPLGWSEEYSGLAKLTTSAIRGARLNYQMVVERARTRPAKNEFRMNPEGSSIQRRLAVSHGADWTQTLGTSSFLTLNVRQNVLRYHDYVYEDVWDPRYDAAGRLIGFPQFEGGVWLQGVDFTRWEQKTDAWSIKSSWTAQTASAHAWKVGGELFLPEVTFGNPGTLVYVTDRGREVLERHIDDPPDFPGVRSYHPVQAAAFVQDQVVWRDLTLRAGIRYDYFDARSTVPSDLANPADSISGVPRSHPRDTTVKSSLSPRLGVAYPVFDTAALHFAYGRFRQLPAIGEIFTNADYSKLARLQAGVVNYTVMGNPDIKPEETVQYEAGYKQAVSEDFGIDVTAFYKDIRNLLGVEFISTYNAAEYPRLTNADFGDVLGITLALDHRALGPVAMSLDYTWQRAIGNSSDPRETATRASAGEDPRPRLVPFNWDQRHTLNVTLSLDKPGDYSASAIFRAASGQPYTPILESGFGFGLATNSGRKPAGATLDLRLEKETPRLGKNTALFARVFNATDSRYFNGPVFASTGSPFYSRFPATDEAGLLDPKRLAEPRRIEVGVRFGSEGW